MIEIRAMREEEAIEVKKLGKKCFEPFESLFVHLPQKCFVAVEDDSIVGAVLYKYIHVGERTIGYVDYIFVDPNCHSKGIGSMLVEACLKAMDASGSDGYSAIVRDDNVASWKMFVNKGLRRYSLYDLTREFGFVGMIKQTFMAPLNIATGMEYYLKLKDQSVQPTKESTTKQLLSYLIFTILIFSSMLISGIDYYISVTGVMIAILGVRVVAGFIGTLFSKEDWYFRITDGGYFIPFVSGFFGGIYIMSGNWYPRIYRKEVGFKRSLGLSSLAQWASLFIMALLTRTLFIGSEVTEIIETMSLLLMFASIIPLYPFSSFGGRRLYQWNKLVYIVVIVLSIGICLL